MFQQQTCNILCDVDMFYRHITNMKHASNINKCYVICIYAKNNIIKIIIEYRIILFNR